MRLTDMQAGAFINANLQWLGRTAHSIVYTEKGNTQSVIKAGGYWIDGEIYGQPSFAKDTSNMLKREAAIYEALGPHRCITRVLALEMRPGSDEAWALRLERAPYGNLREFLLENPPPTMERRLKIAVDLAETLQHLHDHKVIWGDLSPRNMLVFDDLEVKLCDFAGSTLGDVYSELQFGYELRYWTPFRDPDPLRAQGTIAMELWTLGTGICEITEWAIPYGNDDKEVQKKLGNHDYPRISDNNPARCIIEKLWHWQFNSASEVVLALKALID